MNLSRKILPVVFCLLFLSAAQAQEDSVLYAKDSVIEMDPDPTTAFFQSGKRIPPSVKTTLLTKSKKIITLVTWLKSDEMKYSDHTLADLDNDGKKELLISNFTGGAHCCDEIYIFKSIGINKYQHVVKLFAGNTEISPDKLLKYNFYEQFGYFFTCFACGYTDTSDTAPVETHNIVLKYNKGKLFVITGDKELRSTITDNLDKLSEQPYEKLDNGLRQDNGLRKEFALNLAVFYYSFGRNLPETQKLFYKYYKYPDAKKVWAAFVKNLNFVKSDSDF
ncbi:MAG: hypothetical protein ABIU11_05895 [Chitinophagaceae bacterium]